MLDQHTQQLGIDFAQDAPRLGTARLVKMAVAFPELEEQLDLPTGLAQDQRLSEGELVNGNVGDIDAPLR